MRMTGTRVGGAVGPEPPQHNQCVCGGGGGGGIIFSKSFTPESLEVEEVVEGRLLVVKAKVEQFLSLSLSLSVSLSLSLSALFMPPLWRHLHSLDFSSQRSKG